MTGVVVFALGLWLSSCKTVCPSTWETGVEISHSMLYGQIYGTHVTIGGDIGSACHDDEAKDAGAK